MYSQVLLIVGLFLIYYGIKENNAVKKEYNWPIAIGRIIESQIETRDKNKEIIIISKFNNKYFF